MGCGTFGHDSAHRKVSFFFQSGTQIIQTMYIYNYLKNALPIVK